MVEKIKKSIYIYIYIHTHIYIYDYTFVNYFTVYQKHTTL